MVNSMTGFGRSLLSRDGREITVELKSVNHRYLDVSFRMPRHIGFVEDSLRNILSQELKRGHVDVYLFYRNTREDARQVSVDQTLLGAYLEVARGVAERFQLRDDIGLSAALRLPDVTDVIAAEEDREAVCSLAEEACLCACQELKAMRAAEGSRLFADVRSRCETVEALANHIASVRRWWWKNTGKNFRNALQPYYLARRWIRAVWQWRWHYLRTRLTSTKSWYGSIAMLARCGPCCKGMSLPAGSWTLSCKK